MPRPTRNEYRTAILGAFDKQLHCTLKDVVTHLQTTPFFVSEQSTRRMLKRMTQEGLLTEINKRGEKNAVIYTKAVFNQFRQFVTLEGELVSLRAYIHSISQLDSNVIDSKALELIKGLMLEGMASSYQKPYITKGISPVADEEVRRQLNVLLNALSTWHEFIKNYLDSKIWDEHNRADLAKEFESALVEEHAAIVDRTWKSNGNRHKQEEVSRDSD